MLIFCLFLFSIWKFLRFCCFFFSLSVQGFDLVVKLGAEIIHLILQFVVLDLGVICCFLHCGICKMI